MTTDDYFVDEQRGTARPFHVRLHFRSGVSRYVQAFKRRDKAAALAEEMNLMRMAIKELPRVPTA